MPSEHRAIIVMGVSGSGKSKIAELLAKQLDIAMIEGDSLHSPENIAKMTQGQPLTDQDREPWLDRIAAIIDDWRTKALSGIITCSALKKIYRQRLISADPTHILFIYLEGPRELLFDRMNARKNHYMPVSLLDSQLAALEPPTPDEPVLTISIIPSPAAIVATIITALEKTPV